MENRQYVTKRGRRAIGFEEKFGTVVGGRKGATLTTTRSNGYYVTAADKGEANKKTKKGGMERE